MSETKMLFQRGNIGGVITKNRVAMAPMGARPDNDGGFLANTKYLVERAKGGAGLIITGCTTVSDEFEQHPTNAHTSFIQNARLSTMAEQIHHYGSKLCMQISPGIGRMNFIDPFTPPYSASAVPSYAFPDLICKEMPSDGLKRLAKAMGYSSKLAKDAGVDMVEIHAYGGYLIDQFISGYWNKRTDEYGGSFLNRTRFLREIIEQIREFCGNSFPIAVKMTLDSIHPIEERPKQEGLQLAKMLADMGIDLLHIGRGSYSCRYQMVGSVYMDLGYDLDAVKEIKDMLPDLPIMGHGKLNHPDLAERAVAQGHMDYVAIAHGLLADPNWTNKVHQNKSDEIIPCIGCGECHFQAMKGKVLGCAVNPVTGHEGEYELTPAAAPKKVLVVGGGPGGMKAALTADQRGFSTTLWEKKPYLGGELKAASIPYCKKDVAKHVDYLVRQVEMSDIDVQLNLEVDLEDVKSFQPDYVVVATGAIPIRLPVPGNHMEQVCIAEQVLLQEKSVGQNVIVVGGGLVGCETALELARREKNVTIVEMQDDILKTADHFVANDQNLRYLMGQSNIKVMISVKLKEIMDGAIRIETVKGDVEIPCDNVVFAVGFKSDHTLYEQIYETGIACRQIGDNIAPGKVLDAVHGGFHCIRVL